MFVYFISIYVHFIYGFYDFLFSHSVSILWHKLKKTENNNIVQYILEEFPITLFYSFTHTH